MSWHSWKVFCGICVVLFVGWVVYWMFQTPTPEPPPVAEKPPAVLLPEVDRKFLWETETLGLELGQFGWPQLSKALRMSDADAIVKVLADDFYAEISADPLQVEAKRAIAEVRRIKSQGEKWNRLESREFADWLLTQRSIYKTSPPSMSFSLKAISPLNRKDKAGDWKGTAAIEFRGTETSGTRQELIILFEFLCGHPDRENLLAGGWLQWCRVLQVNIAQSDHALFREVAKDRGLPTDLHDNWVSGGNVVNTGGVYLCDYNRDGCLDAVLIDTTKPAPVMLYRGSPDGQFAEATREVGLASAPIAYHAAFADLDRDGWEDLILPGVAVYRNRNGQFFDDVTRSTNLTDLIELNGPLVNITGMAVADYDRDGRVDLYVTRGDAENFKSGSWIDGKSGMKWQNQLLRNLGGGKFQDVTRATGTAGGHRSVFTASWQDFNNDNRPDLYIIHEFGPGTMLIQRPNGTFAAHQLAERSSDFGSMGLASGDINNDGLTDVFVSNMYSKAGNRVIDNLPPGHYDDEIMRKLRRMVAGSELYVNRGDLSFEVVADRMQISKIGWGWGAALVDLDNDGWLDLYSTAGFISVDKNKPDG